MLNEVFAAERDVGKISVYSLEVDGNEINPDKTKSSGIIISTGTGSSGWLLSARRMALSDVRAILHHLGNNQNEDLVILSIFTINLDRRTPSQ